MQFFTIRHGETNYFEDLEIWQKERFRKLYGTFPVIFLTFAGVKEDTYEGARTHFCMILAELYEKYPFLGDNTDLLQQLLADRTNVQLSRAINRISQKLEQYYNKKVIILLDEYDTPMQEAYVHGFWSLPHWRNTAMRIRRSL